MVKPIYIKHKRHNVWVTRHDHTSTVTRAERDDVIKTFHGNNAESARALLASNSEWVEITEEEAFALFPQLRTAIYPEVTAASAAWEYGDAW